MKFGLSRLASGALATPEACARISRAAEAAGFDSLWIGEHVVLPDPPVLLLPELVYRTQPPETPLLEPLVAFAFIAAHTRRVRLVTGVLILPQRNPLVLAKQVATLDVLCGGRFVLGIGVGQLEAEMAAVGVPMEHRGTRADEYLAAMIAIWTQRKPAFSGRWSSFSGVAAYPRPVQQPHPPIVVGGDSPAAFRRTARYGGGWYGFDLDVEQAAAAVDQIGRLASNVEISISPKGGMVRPGEANLYAEVGVDRLILRLPNSDLSAALRFIRKARAVIAE